MLAWDMSASRRAQGWLGEKVRAIEERPVYPPVKRERGGEKNRSKQDHWGSLCARATHGLSRPSLGLLACLGVSEGELWAGEKVARIGSSISPHPDPILKGRRARLEGASVTLLDDAVGISSHPRWLAWC